MKASDFIVEFLIDHHITDVFGYPGGMVTHLMDSFDKYRDKITAHLNYHEQACAMAACGWAEITKLPGIAYATSGPGATNLLTGIACAFFESLPCIFITGQVNTYEQKGDLHLRQKGFQETDIVSMAKPITKMAVMAKRASDLPELLNRAFYIAMEGRPGPVLLDIPMDIFRSEISKISVAMATDIFSEGSSKDTEKIEMMADEIISELQKAKRPVVLAGHGISLSNMTASFRSFIKEIGTPVVTSMIAIDAIPSESPYSFGMIGAYGSRWANYMINYSDCILSIGSRLDCRQTGVKRDAFAPRSKILRIDIDENELKNEVGIKENQYCALLQNLLPILTKKSKQIQWDFQSWLECCGNVRNKLQDVDPKEPGNLFIKELSKILPSEMIITTDVGQNQVWVAQSLCVKEGQHILFSGGHGAMGYSLPAAIGAAIAAKKTVISVVGDGGLQMNLQELQFIAREQLPIKIILLNNHSLGMIHHFQEMYFDGNYVQTDASKGFTVPNFLEIIKAYGIRAFAYSRTLNVSEIISDDKPAFIEVDLPENTYVFPKLGVNKPIHIQEPLLNGDLAKEIDTIFSEIT